MKLTKKDEKDLMQVYDSWWYSYLNGDVKTYDSFLSEDYRFIGSTNNEDYLNRQATTKFFEDTAEQLAGKAELRNLERTMDVIEKDLVLLTDLANAYVLSGSDWVFYSRFRFTSLMKKTKEGWRFTYQHFSAPDNKAQEGETLGTEQISKENQELRDAIKRRTVELEHSNRELAIEAALERVRARTMAMQHSKELQDAAFLMFQQIETLGISVFGCGFNIWDEDKKASTAWMAGENRIQPPFKTSSSEDIFVRIHAAAKKGDLLFVEEQGGEVLQNHYKYMSSIPVFKDVVNEMSENGHSLPDYQIMHCAFFSHGYLMFISFDPVPNAHDIFKRFAKVFEQTYTRFLDLKKAEAQAREAQIETALERVRSRTIAMQNSDELQEASFLLDEQVRGLGIKTWGCAFNIYGEKESTEWFGNEAGILPTYKVPRAGIFKKYYKQGQKGESLLIKEFSGDECLAHYEYMSSLPIIGDVLKNLKETNNGFPTYQIDHVVYFKYGYLLFITREHVPKAYDIFKRFAKVFEQTYTRFLDLQKAEAQAREAQIETALERVRAQSMGMHSSQELKDVIRVIFDQMGQININAEHAGIVIDFEPKKDWHFWVAETQDIPAKITVPYLDSIWDRQFTEAKQNNKALFTTLLNFEEKNAFYKKLLPHIEGLTKEMEDHYFKRNGLAASTALQKDIGLYIENFSGTPYTDEENSILLRFAQVFQQTYTRFLDLQKAEAQARESQIEAALEKVRSRTMAMQKSEELPEAANNLFLQLQELGLPAWSAGYCIWQDEKKNASCNMSTEGQIQKSFILPSIGEGYDFYTPSISGKSFHIHELGGEALVKHYEFMVTLPVVGEILDGIIKSGFSLPTFQIFHIVYFKYGYVMFITYESMPHAHDIFKRFGKVFEQTYTRFLDLQKAEAQTRDAQINLAVERVRAKALAMHKSEEIINVVAKLKDEVMSLDIPDVVAATIFLNDGDDKVRMWDLSSIEIDDNHSEIPFDLTFKIKKTDPYFYVKRVWENPEDYFVEIQEEKGFQRLMQWLRELDKKEIADEVEDFIEKTQLKRLYHVVKKLNNGKLAIDLLNPPSNEMETILTKMGAAFDLAYKRFEDLQKAEAQTKEARIEAALERVRSRSMAMHKSEELLDVISVVSEQLIQLDFRFIHVSFANNDMSKDYKFWTAYKGMFKPIRFNIPYLDIAIFNKLRKAQKNSIAFYSDILTNEEHIQWHKHLLKHGGSKIFSKEENDFIMSRGMARSISINPNIMLILANYASIPYSDEENTIIARFGKVFEQSYTRFLDLQKAEAQAKESEIELALERIRARTMAMHKSSELGEVAAVLFEQISTLNDTPSRFNIAIVNEEDKSFDIWLTDQSGKNVNQQFVFRSVKSPVVNEIFKAWKTNKSHIIQDLHGKKLEEWIRYSSTEVGVPFDKSQVKKHRYISSICFKNGFMGITTDVHPEQDEIQLLERFTKVFEQTYTRFLDLEKAEAQAMIAEQNLINLKTEKKRAEEALAELQHTQKQLIQSEKMASLGELTAGIAHEIQNPLNFVNNFSEVSNELLDEMNEEIKKGDLEEVKFIMADIKSNLEKINHHGRRADAIVKGMLQHSRKSTADKEPTDINKLADEYFRLAYHGLRAKDRAFNAALETEFDPTVGQIEVISQDIGRVILNLITNAFYAVDEKKKTGIPNYEPMVLVKTKKQKDKIQITVKDNGDGIPKNVLDKIFQPFFTTKPTGQGTGLGLSMSYDIVTKGHNGELTAETEQGTGTEFMISLPI